MPLSLDPSVGVELAADAVARATGAGADAAKVLHRYEEDFEVNFDTDDVSLIRSTVTDALSITVFCDQGKGTAQLTGRSHDEVDRAVEHAITSARAGQPDAANVLPSDPAEPAVSDGVEQPDQEAMVDSVLRLIERVKDEYPTILSRDSSHYSFTSSWSSYANSYGRTQHARRGRYTAQVLAAGKDDEQSTSFNYTGQVGAAPFGELIDLPPIRRLLDGITASFGARPIPATFVGDVIFTPDSMLTLAGTVAQALSGLTLMRKATPFLDSLGTAIAAPGFNLAHRPSELAAAAPFDSEGFVNHDLDIVRDGVLHNFLIDWYTSHKLDRPMTTGCVDLVVAPGDAALDDLIAATEQGILLGRFSGGQPNQNLDFSGVAKNSFYVEGGEIVGPIVETMIAGNFRTALESIRAISRETVDFGAMKFPWLAVAGVTISTK